MGSSCNTSIKCWPSIRRLAINKNVGDEHMKTRTATWPLPSSILGPLAGCALVALLAFGAGAAYPDAAAGTAASEATGQNASATAAPAAAGKSDPELQEI